MAKLSSLSIMVLFFLLLSAGSCKAKRGTCELQIPYNCGGQPEACGNQCANGIGGFEALLEAQCRRESGSSRGSNYFYCDCYYVCDKPRKMRTRRPAGH